MLLGAPLLSRARFGVDRREERMASQAGKAVGSVLNGIQGLTSWNEGFEVIYVSEFVLLRVVVAVLGLLRNYKFWSQLGDF